MSSPSQTLTFILQSILEDSTDVTVTDRQENNVTILEVAAPSELKGRIIGKNGRIINAIRIIVSISFPQQRIIIRIID